MVKQQHFDNWKKIAEGKKPDWDNLFQGYDATVAWPPCFFYQELYGAYPQAKFVLTTRDPERWADSISRVIKLFPRLQGFTFIPRARKMMSLMNTFILPKLGSLEPDKAHLIKMINEHNQAVKAFIPTEQLFY